MDKKFKTFFYFAVRIVFAGAFFFYAYQAFAVTVEFTDILRNSFAVSLPFFAFYQTAFLIGTLNILAGLILISGFFKKFIATWTFVWMIGVIIAMGSENLTVNLIYLTISIYLIWTSFFSTKNILKSTQADK